MVAPLVILAAALFGQTAQAQTSTASQPSVDPSQMSLAERAAAARKTHSRTALNAPELTPEQRGLIQGTRYGNEFFGFQIDMSNQWHPLDALRKAASRAKAREVEAEIGAHDSSPEGNVLEVEDDVGGNVILTVAPLPPNAPRNTDEVA